MQSFQTAETTTHLHIGCIRKLVNLVRAGRWLVAVVLVDDDGVGDVLHHDALEPQVAGESPCLPENGSGTCCNWRSSCNSILFLRRLHSALTCQLLIHTPLVVFVSKQVSTFTFSTMSVVRFLPRLPMLCIRTRVAVLISKISDRGRD
jgi:hypothetical protein